MKTKYYIEAANVSVEHANKIAYVIMQVTGAQSALRAGCPLKGHSGPSIDELFKAL